MRCLKIYIFTCLLTVYMCTCMHGTSTAVYICIWRPEDNLMESVFWVLGIKLSSQVWCKLLHPLSHLSGSLAGSCKALSDLSWSQTALEENSRGQRQPKSRGEKRAELGKSIGNTVGPHLCDPGSLSPASASPPWKANLRNNVSKLHLHSLCALQGNGVCLG